MKQEIGLGLAMVFIVGLLCVLFVFLPPPDDLEKERPDGEGCFITAIVN